MGSFISPKDPCTHSHIHSQRPGCAWGMRLDGGTLTAPGARSASLCSQALTPGANRGRRRASLGRLGEPAAATAPGSLSQGLDQLGRKGTQQ